MSKSIQYVKINRDDILEILLEHFQEQFCCCETAKGIILGTPEKDLRFIGAFSDEWDDSFVDINLELIDGQIPYNGDHSFLEANSDFCIDSI